MNNTIKNITILFVIVSITFNSIVIYADSPNAKESIKNKDTQGWLSTSSCKKALLTAGAIGAATIGAVKKVRPKRLHKKYKKSNILNEAGGLKGDNNSGGPGSNPGLPHVVGFPDVGSGGTTLVPSMLPITNNPLAYISTGASRGATAAPGVTVDITNPTDTGINFFNLPPEIIELIIDAATNDGNPASVLPIAGVSRDFRRILIDGLSTLDFSRLRPGLVERITEGDIIYLLHRFPNLRAVNLTGINITINIMHELRELRRLTTLILNTNITDEMVRELQDMTQLQHLDLGNARVTDGIADVLRDMRQLQHLDLHGTQVTDVIADALSKMTQLQYLNLSGTRVGDRIVAALRGMTQLQHLDLGNTRVTDVIADALSKMTQLQYLDLGYTQVTDGIADALSNMTRLQCLDLHNIRVTDRIAGALSNMTQLQRLDLHDTRVTDGIADALSKMGQLQHLDLHDNDTRVTDGIADALSNMTQLQHLDLGNTRVTDVIADALSKMTQLQYLSLRDTQVTDVIADALSKMSQLQCLDLSGTRVGDKIVATILNMPLLQILWLKRTQVTYAIKDIIKDMIPLVKSREPYRFMMPLSIILDHERVRAWEIRL